jgi:hypothetical protein
VALAALTVLMAMTTVVAADGGAAATPHQDRAAKKADSVALFGAVDGGFQAVTGVAGSQPRDSKFFDIGGVAAATAINPRGATDGFLCSEGSRIKPVHGLRNTPRLSDPDIDASDFDNEGDDGYAFLCSGVAEHGSFALAGGASQGLLQLRRKDGRWKIDRRVHSPGTDDGATPEPHRPGWINFRNSVTRSTLFTSVAIAPTPLRNGKFLAITIDREDGTLVVVTGAGTANPHAVGVLQSAALNTDDRAFGTGGMAFLPSSRDRAVIVTRNGFGVLDLKQPDRPRLRVKTTIGDGSVVPISITVSSDADHLAVAAGAKVYGYRNVLAAVKDGKPFKRQVSFRLNGSGAERVSDLAYTNNDTLVVLHGDDAVITDWSLTLVKKVARGRHVVRDSLATTLPGADGSLSVWPAP